MMFTVITMVLTIGGSQSLPLDLAGWWWPLDRLSMKTLQSGSMLPLKPQPLPNLPGAAIGCDGVLGTVDDNTVVLICPGPVINLFLLGDSSMEWELLSDSPLTPLQSIDQSKQESYQLSLFELGCAEKQSNWKPTRTHSVIGLIF